MRVLGRVRLSRYNEESTSIIRQRDLITNWAEANGHTIVGWAEDIEVSGSISPFEAPELGPWLREPLMHEWDILCSWKLDRIARQSIALHRVFAWVTENNKTLVCVSDNIDLSTWVGRLIASVIAGIAEGELEAITERIRAGKAQSRKEGRYNGGTPPYGYRLSTQPDSTLPFEHDPKTQKVLQEIIELKLKGVSITEIARILTQKKIPSPGTHTNPQREGVWHPSTVRSILTNRSLLGWAHYRKQPILDSQGKPTLIGPPSISLEKFQKLQELVTIHKSPTRPHKTSPILGVAVCWECGANLHKNSRRIRNGVYESYKCGKCADAPSLNGKQLVSTIYESFEAALGDKPLQHRVQTDVHALQKDLNEAEKAYQDIAEYLPSAPNSEARQQLFRQLNIVSERIKHLKETIGTTPEVRWESTGETYLERWKTLDAQQKRKFLLELGIKVRVRQITPGGRNTPGVIETDMVIPNDLQERLRTYAEENTPNP